MPAYGCEFYLLVVNSKIKFISTRGHVISSIYFYLSRARQNTEHFQIICRSVMFNCSALLETNIGYVIVRISVRC